jgi:hypothetical protein
MPRLLRHLLPLCVTPLLASCAFLLDYDDLQSRAATETGGIGGVPSTSESGAPAIGGQGGDSASACGDCNDHDACTVDTCDETGDAPTCLHEPTEGLKLDGFETTLTADRFVRVSLVASGQLFYLAALRVDKDVPRVSLHRLASDGLELEPVGTDLKLEGIPVSNVGLAVEELALGDVALHGFLAAKPKVGDLTPRVFHLVNHANKTTSNLVGMAYKADDESVFPQALSMGGRIVGAWIQPDGTIAVHDVGSLRTDTFGATTVPATTLSLISTGDNKPAVLFTAQTGTSAIGTYVETSGQNRSRLEECEMRAGQYLSSSVIGTQVPGLWLATITRFGDDYLTSGSGTVLCGNNACSAIPEDCAKAIPANGIRDIAGAAVHFATDDPGILYSVVAIPQIGLKPDDATTAEAKLSLALSRADVSAPGNADSTTIGGDVDTGLLEIARNDTSKDTGFVGPDWPAVGILPSQQVAVAWIQPAASPGAAAASELHVQRYKMCLPPP